MSLPSSEDPTMAPPLTRLTFYTQSLKSFISSRSTFRILRSLSPTIPLPSTPPTPTNLTSMALTLHDKYYPAKTYDAHTIPQSPSETPQTLYILDSSFNPPTRAHAHICLSALRDHYASSELRHTKARLLLLLSTQNADKKITGATLEQRLVGIECFANDLLTSWFYPHSGYYYANKKKSEASTSSKSTSRTDSENENENESEDEEIYSSDTESASSEPDAIFPASTSPTSPTHPAPEPSELPGPAPEIDIALTSLPYFHSKSSAIENSAIYPPGTTHIHCTGYDTLIRVLNPQYYPPTHTLSPLLPFLAHHKLRVTYRGPGDPSDQDAYLSNMKSKLPQLGGRKSWITEGRIYMAAGLEGKEISSTTVRVLVRSHSTVQPHMVGSGSRKYRGKGKGAEKKIKEGLKPLVGDAVRKWILGERLFWVEKRR
ncbi:hypothetical protein NHQ30_008458 [Ciborinia camelliae]|nr:hypothetical protein NHQ30_008458 [Ciborinia camelliae]